MADKLNILVLAGGNSGEREVSLSSAAAIVEALKRLGHNLHVIDAASGRSLLDNKGKYLLSRDNVSESRIAMKSSDTLILSESLKSDEYKNIDLIFIALHGGAGEDGTIQALLDLIGKKYTGSGMLASALAMNKAIAKKLVSNEHIPTPKSILLTAADYNYERAAKIITTEFACPFIVKPNNGGSTVGLSLVKDTESLGHALKLAFDMANEALVETYIRGREITSAILDGESFPLVEIVPSNELYDYQCKYTKGKSKYICPAPISENAAAGIKDYALRAFKALGCSGLARVDFILDKNDNPWFLELNTIPGMTELSLAPMAAMKAGLSFDKLIERICDSALKK